MNGLKDMIGVVREQILNTGQTIQASTYLNNNRNYYIQTNCGYYILKWNDSEFGMAGIKCPQLGKGAGMTISLDVYERFRTLEPTILFALAKDDIIRFLPFNELDRLSANYKQHNGEWVRVVLTKSLITWYTPKTDPEPILPPEPTLANYGIGDI